MSELAPVTQALATDITDEAAARIQKIPSPVVDPGHCGICGKSEHPQGFLDFRLDFEWFGTLIFCYDCAATVAASIGYISSDTYAALQAENIRLITEFEVTVAALEALETGLDHLANYHHARNVSDSNASDDGVDSSDDSGSDEGEPNESGNVIEFTAREPEPESITDESVSVEGPDDVSSDSSDGDSDSPGPLGF